jgi:hypothetical protein
VSPEKRVPRKADRTRPRRSRRRNARIRWRAVVDQTAEPQRDRLFQLFSNGIDRSTLDN